MSIPEDFVVERHTKSSYPSEDITILAERVGIDTASITGYTLGVYNGFSEVAVIEYYVFPSDDVGYLGWIEVDEDWRRQGIARELQNRAVDHLLDLGVREVWAGPVADVLQATITSRGFEPADLPDLSDYYVYTV